MRRYQKIQRLNYLLSEQLLGKNYYLTEFGDLSLIKNGIGELLACMVQEVLGKLPC